VIESYRREKEAKVKLDAKQLNALTGKCRGKVGKEGEGTTATHPLATLVALWKTTTHAHTISTI
jgi:hypothetical protein